MAFSPLSVAVTFKILPAGLYQQRQRLISFDLFRVVSKPGAYIRVIFGGTGIFMVLSLDPPGNNAVCHDTAFPQDILRRAYHQVVQIPFAKVQIVLFMGNIYPHVFQDLFQPIPGFKTRQFQAAFGATCGPALALGYGVPSFALPAIPDVA